MNDLHEHCPADSNDDDVDENSNIIAQDQEIGPSAIQSSAPAHRTDTLKASLIVFIDSWQVIIKDEQCAVAGQ